MDDHNLRFLIFAQRNLIQIDNNLTDYINQTLSTDQSPESFVIQAERLNNIKHYYDTLLGELKTNLNETNQRDPEMIDKHFKSLMGVKTAIFEFTMNSSNANIVKILRDIYDSLIKIRDCYLENKTQEKYLMDNIERIIKEMPPNKKKHLAHEFKDCLIDTTGESSYLNMKLGDFIRAATKKTHLEIWTQSYFLKLYSGKFVKISFEEKTEGIQIGSVVNVYYSNNEKDELKRYYVKTHSGGLRSVTNKVKKIDPREIFVYKLLENLNIMPKVHMFFSDLDPTEFYFATEDLGNDFQTFQKLTANSSYLQEFRDKKLEKELIYVIFLNKLLFLSDVTTNNSNYGVKLNKIKVVDFLILEPNHYTSNIITSFMSNSYTTKSKEILQIFEYSNGFKTEITPELIKMLSFENYFMHKMKQTKEFVDDYLRKNGESLLQETYADQLKELNKYFDIVSENFKIFCEKFKEQA